MPGAPLPCAWSTSRCGATRPGGGGAQSPISWSRQRGCRQSLMQASAGPAIRSNTGGRPHPPRRWKRSSCRSALHWHTHTASHFLASLHAQRGCWNVTGWDEGGCGVAAQSVLAWVRSSPEYIPLGKSAPARLLAMAGKGHSAAHVFVSLRVGKREVCLDSSGFRTRASLQRRWAGHYRLSNAHVVTLGEDEPTFRRPTTARSPQTWAAHSPMRWALSPCLCSFPQPRWRPLLTPDPPGRGKRRSLLCALPEAPASISSPLAAIRAPWRLAQAPPFSTVTHLLSSAMPSTFREGWLIYIEGALRSCTSLINPGCSAGGVPRRPFRRMPGCRLPRDLSFTSPIRMEGRPNGARRVGGWNSPPVLSCQRRPFRRCRAA